MSNNKFSSDDTYRLETDKTVCKNCDYEHQNTQDSYIHLDPGHYCPECGSQFEDGDRFTEVEIIDLSPSPDTDTENTETTK